MKTRLLTLLAVAALTLTLSGTAFASDLTLKKSTAACSLSADSTLANIVAIEHLDGPLKGVILVVEDTNPYGAMPTLVLHLLFAPEPDAEQVCFGLSEGEKVALFHKIDLRSARIDSFDQDGATLLLEVTDDFNLSYTPRLVSLKINTAKKSVELLASTDTP